MENLNFIKSEDTKSLKWNEKSKRYELKVEFVKQEMDVHFADDAILEKRIKDNSRNVYAYFKRNSYSGNFDYIGVLLNETKEGHEFLTEVLLEQLKADNETAYNDLTRQPAINVANGQILNRDELLRNQISVATEILIDNNPEYFGFNIFMMCPYPLEIQLLLSRR